MSTVFYFYTLLEMLAGTKFVDARLFVSPEWLRAHDARPGAL